MTTEEADEFVSMVSAAWQPALNDVQADLWRNLCEPLDARAAFQVLTRLFREAQFRPKPPEYMHLYQRELVDTTPVHSATPTDRDEMPEWVGGWRLAFAAGDQRLWPEMEKGARQIHAAWEETLDRAFARRHNLKSGYEWEADVAERGIMPQADRIEYMRRWHEGERPWKDPLGLAG